MNRIRNVLFVALVLAVACGGGGSDPVEPPDDQPVPEIESGTFTVTSAEIINGCEIPTAWGGTYDIEIDSTSFKMGTWTGTWDRRKLFAVAEGAKDVTQTRDCTVTRWTTVYITFKTKDTFKGTVMYRLRLAGDCGTRTTCTSSWGMAGTRVDSLAAGP